MQHNVLHLEIELNLSILWVWQLKIGPQSKKWSETVITSFWTSCAKLSCDHLIFDPGPKYSKCNYSFHWKLKGDRALILTYLDSQMAIFNFGHLQLVNWGQSWTENCNLGYIPCLCKNSSFPKCFKYVFVQLWKTIRGQNFSSTWRSLLELLP